jgi:hypothetical protein
MIWCETVKELTPHERIMKQLKEEAQMHGLDEHMGGY